MTSAELFAPTSFVLGEGPIRTTSGFACVDIRSGHIVDGSIDGSITETTTVDAPVGAIATTSDGRRLAATGRTIRVLDEGPEIRLVDQATDIRFNDGKADAAGRFLCGTMADPPRPGAGALWSFEAGEARLLLDDVTISNGLAWSGDGTTLFYVDTPTQRIDAFDYDLTTGAISERRTIVEIDPELGSPDGMTIDANGGLWVALWGGSAVHCYRSGRLDEVIDVPTPYVTCPTFIGPDLDLLLITTASEPNPDDPSAGQLYAARPHVVGTPPVEVDVQRVFAGPEPVRRVQRY